jgi:hypothetical protein
MNERPQPQPYDELSNHNRWNLDELKALSLPATKLQIAKCLALLVKSFPNAGSADAEVYGGMLLQDVVAAKPTIGDLEEACRHIRRTSRFLPTIAEVLETLATTKETRRTITFSIGATDVRGNWLEHTRRTKVHGLDCTLIEHRPATPATTVTTDDHLALPL